MKPLGRGDIGIGVPGWRGHPWGATWTAKVITMVVCPPWASVGAPAAAAGLGRITLGGCSGKRCNGGACSWATCGLTLVSAGSIMAA